MQYIKFRIRNFKGIKDTTVHLGKSGNVGVFTFVGLNESGKTTILEAIHSFSPELATSKLLGAEGIPFSERVPRHLLSNFTGDVSVEATLAAEPAEISAVIRTLARDANLLLDPESIPKELVFERHQRFSKGDLQASYFTLWGKIRVKSPKQKKWRAPTNGELTEIRDAFYSNTPDIAYFPTFVFDFPKQIFLTGARGGAINSFYQRLFQDILDYDGKGHTIDDDILRRVREPKLVGPWIDFLGLWNRRDDKEKIQHVIDRAGSVVTQVVFGRWNKIFRDDARGKEVVVLWDTVEGEKRDAKGAVVKTEEHDVYIKFQIKDGTRRFDVNDRSLGFRWFFAFMLFTQFRVARDSSRPMVFLFDEPASNLHAAAQQKLIESFPEVAKGKHKLIYTTHSHYMIEPKWLEQTFIVTNRSDAPPDSVIDAISLDDESLDIKVSAYRDFVDKNPSKTSYFQPVLDRLEVVPSRLDISKSSIVVEGKSDYYILRYASKLHKMPDLPIVPGLGAGTLGSLVALHVGWNLNMLFVLDSDKKGRDERQKYVDEYGLRIDRSLILSELLPEISVIEDLVDGQAKSIIATHIQIDSQPSKQQLRRFFQERLAADEVIHLGDIFGERSKLLMERLQDRLHNNIKAPGIG
ncbi:ATP-dependent endonuclease [Rhizobium leguminosarum]|uniref:ATP-dependent nuclease n=1 Tax=Rhizobium leguminosarum TaxID=384 RepID=UPI0036DCCC9B